MVRGGVIPAVVLGGVGVVVGAVLDGRQGAYGGVMGLVVALAALSSGLLLTSVTARRAPHLVVVVAMASFFVKVGLLALVLVAFSEADWLSGRAFALAGMAAVAGWLPGEVWAFTRTRTLVYDVESTR